MCFIWSRPFFLYKVVCFRQFVIVGEHGVNLSLPTPSQLLFRMTFVIVPFITPCGDSSLNTND